MSLLPKFLFAGLACLTLAALGCGPDRAVDDPAAVGSTQGLAEQAPKSATRCYDACIEKGLCPTKCKAVCSKGKDAVAPDCCDGCLKKNGDGAKCKARCSKSKADPAKGECYEGCVAKGRCPMKCKAMCSEGKSAVAPGSCDDCLKKGGDVAKCKQACAPAKSDAPRCKSSPVGG